jgi:hypothetical protein
MCTKNSFCPAPLIIVIYSDTVLEMKIMRKNYITTNSHFSDMSLY